jgi:hypothetical protein
LPVALPVEGLTATETLETWLDGLPIVYACVVMAENEAADALVAVTAARGPKVTMDSATAPANSLARLHPNGVFAVGTVSCI